MIVPSSQSGCPLPQASAGAPSQAQGFALLQPCPKSKSLSSFLDGNPKAYKNVLENRQKNKKIFKANPNLYVKRAYGLVAKLIISVPQMTVPLQAFAK